MSRIQKLELSDRQEDLLPRWSGLWMALGVLRAPNVGPLIDRYSSPARHYHNLGHLRACLAELDRVRHLACDAPGVELALWYHDAIYDPTRSDNEQRSADLAREDSKRAGLSPERIELIVSLILATRHDSPPATADQRLIVDIDLAILGGEQAEFDAYEVAIRQEYAHVPESDFRRGRAAILQRFLDRPRIYTTDYFHGKYEAAARANLRRSIDGLTRSS
jgi:predicted metal-dependent HD superfamily phosphohydrolase